MTSDQLVLAQIRDWHRSIGESDLEDLDPLDLWERLGDLLALDPAAATASQPVAAAGIRYCEDCDGFGVFDLTLNNPGVWYASCNGTGRA